MQYVDSTQYSQLTPSVCDNFEIIFYFKLQFKFMDNVGIQRRKGFSYQVSDFINFPCPKIQFYLQNQKRPKLPHTAQVKIVRFLV